MWSYTYYGAFSGVPEEGTGQVGRGWCTEHQLPKIVAEFMAENWVEGMVLRKEAGNNSLPKEKF